MVTFIRQNTIALIALLVALGGTSYAAAQLPKNSVKAPQIASNAVRSDEVKNGSLRPADLKPGTLPQRLDEPLRSGTTITGFIHADLDSPSAGADWQASDSFPVQLPGQPGQGFIDGVTPGESCTGNADNPTAPPNVLCVYISGSNNPDAGPGTHFLGRNRFGFSISWTSPTTGDTYVRATWAFTQG